MANFFQNNKYYLNHPEMQKKYHEKNSLIIKSPTFNRTFEHTTYLVILMQKFRLKSLYKKSVGHSFLLGT